MKTSALLISIITLLAFTSVTQGQATKSYPFAIGPTTCGGNNGEVHFYDYDDINNKISTITDNAALNPVGRYTPQLRIGNSQSNKQRFIAFGSSISFNPKDHNIYFSLMVSSAFSGSGPVPRTYIWNWPIGDKPSGSGGGKLDTTYSFPGLILGLVFDDKGNCYGLEVSDTKLGGEYPVYLYSIDLATRTLGAKSKLSLTGGAQVLTTGNGDVMMTPSGQMFFVVDNKLFTPDYRSYDGSGNPITCTYVAPVANGSGNYVGLTYAQGKSIAAYWGSGCNFYEMNMLSGASSKIVQTGTFSPATDMASAISGIGASKKLVSVTPTGTSKQYDVVYDVYIRNYGNMDVTNVQVTDDLRNINGAGNVTLTSVAFTDNPAGLTLNPSYNGKSNINLLNGTGTLPNYPVENNHATIRITCRLSNIQPGVVYNNNAIVTSTDFNGNTLTDVSTNGSNPDPNGNDKPDDVGEDRPTPLLITVAASSEPCFTLGEQIYRQSFGTGGGKNLMQIAGYGGVLVPQTQYTGAASLPVQPEQFYIAKNANIGDPAKWINLTDHTGTAPDGRMLLVNADSKANVIYSDEVTPVCANQQYSFFFYGAFIGNSSYKTICDGFGGFKYPKVTIRIRDKATGLVITQLSTAEITSASWQQYGLKFTMPTGFGTVYLELLNDGDGGCGNDLAIDDIQFGLCSPAPTVNIGTLTDGCYGASTTFSATLSDPTAISGALEYQWQIADDDAGPWTNISGATSATYTIPSVGPADVNKYYRVIVAATGNMGTPSCEYTSPGYLLTAKNPSVAPTAALTSHANVCPGKTITLSVQGGTLGTGANWKWYSGSCGGTLVGTGATISVSPSVTTTYYVRAEGDCNITSCQQVTVTVNCDIDKDKDGIPDWVESNITASFGDHDGDGIVNAYDVDYPGFVDNNGDFINDWFQADGDVDGDGIPNYSDTDFPGRVDINGDGVDDRFDTDLDGIVNMLDLDSDNDGIPDVVEAGGVDQDGDGKLDNFIDADGDGLHDLVDANLSGSYNSGVGLGLKDTDKDGVPNQFDLDSDNDGIPDVREVGGADANNDGHIDGFTDTNGDGISDNIVGSNALLRTGPDNNNDGRADSYPYHNMDRDGVPNPYDLDSDGDGIVDVVEAGLSDSNFDGKVDGFIGTNGWASTVSSLPSLTLRNSDGDTNPDYLDIDSDNDGIPDLIEGPATNQFKFPLGTDADNDGIDDAFDSRLNVWGGYGNYQIDTDGDGVPDYLDLDADGDGVPDIKEGHDYDFDGIFNENTTLTGVDTDGDGLDDVFDLDNTSAKGTSSNLGNGGSTAGDPTPGTRAVVQQTPPSAPNRDWRYIDFALEITQFNFTGAYGGGSVSLNWDFQSPEEVVSFEILRSTDNLHFETIKVMGTHLQGGQQGHFNYLDMSLPANSQNVFYKLIITGVTGRAMTSDVIRVGAGSQNQQITIQPNPASTSATLNFTSLSSGKAQVRIVNNDGKVVYAKIHQVIKGKNSIEFTNLSGYPNGVYNVQVLMSNELMNIRLLIAR